MYYIVFFVLKSDSIIDLTIEPANPNNSSITILMTLNVSPLLLISLIDPINIYNNSNIGFFFSFSVFVIHKTAVVIIIKK